MRHKTLDFSSDPNFNEKWDPDSTTLVYGRIVYCSVADPVGAGTFWSEPDQYEGPAPP